MNQIPNIEENEFENYIYQLYQQYFSLEEKGLIPHTTHSVTDSVNFEEIVLKHKEIIHQQLQKAREEERDRYKKYLKYHYENYGIESLRELITTPLDHSELDQPTPWQCGKCTQERDGVKGDEIPEHHRSCKQRTELDQDNKYKIN